MSIEDRRAAVRIAQLALKDASILNDDDLAPLKHLVESLGGRVPVKAAAAAAAAPAGAEDDGYVSEPDPERWTLDALPGDYVFPTADPTDPDADEKAVEKKGAAADALAEGDLPKAISLMNEALALKPASAMYWALRAEMHLKAKKAAAALKDADRALALNSENARAHRVKGTVNRFLGKWEDAALDLNRANQIDFSEATAELLKVVQPRANKRREWRRHKELKEQEEKQARLRKQREEEQRREREEAAREAAAAGGAHHPHAHPHAHAAPPQQPGGFPGGFPGGAIPPGMEALFSDPDVQAALQDPEVAQKLMMCMSNPMMAAQLMMDPKVGPIMQKIMAKMGGGMGGGMGGMGGGAPPRGPSHQAPPPPQQQQQHQQQQAPPKPAAPSSSAAPPASQRRDELD